MQEAGGQFAIRVHDLVVGFRRHVVLDHLALDVRRGEILERRLHRRDRLAASVLHQHDRWNSNLVDRPAIGLAHLSRGQDAHG